MLLKRLLSGIEYSVAAGDIDGVDISRVEYDSRRSGREDLFVCLAGARTDGHVFAPLAYENGCRAFLVERKLDLPRDAVQIVTGNTRRALAVISATFYDRPSDELHVIGITGTKGKTTTALLVHSVLNAAGISCAYIGSNGVIINGEHIETMNTTPESLELHHFFSMMRSSGVTHVALEVSSQALDHYRVHGIDFDITVFTNLFRDHISPVEHASFEEYKAAKSKLFSDYNKRLIVYNADDGASLSVISGDKTTERVSVSVTDSGADFFASNVEPYRDTDSLGVTFDCVHDGKTTPVRLMTPGKFSVYNGLCAIAVASYYGVPVELASDILRDTSVTGRFEVVRGLPGRTFIIDYAHNGVSLTSALSVLREYDPERIICVFGSVGGRTQERRRELAEASAKYADYTVITSDNPDFEPASQIAAEIESHLGPDAPHEIIVDRETAVRRTVRMSRPGDIVLFAGKGHERYQLIGGIKVPFSERAVIIDECRAVIAEEMEKRAGLD